MGTWVVSSDIGSLAADFARNAVAFHTALSVSFVENRALQK